MQAPKGQGNTTEPIGAGTHQAVCYMVVDMGTHKTSYGNKRQLLIGWEVPKYRIEIDGADKPRAVRRWFNFTMYKESDLCKGIEGWSAKQFKDQDAADAFEFKKLLGKNCLLTTSINKNGYDKVESIGCLMDGMEELRAENDFIYYSIDEHGANIPDCVYDKTADKIRQCLELTGEEQEGQSYQPQPTTGGFNAKQKAQLDKARGKLPQEDTRDWSDGDPDDIPF